MRSGRFPHLGFDSGRLLRVSPVVAKILRPGAYTSRECLPTFFRYAELSSFLPTCLWRKVKSGWSHGGHRNMKMRLYRRTLTE